LTDTCCRIQVARSGYMLTVSRRPILFIYVTVDLYPFVSSNRRTINWRQFCCRYKKNVDGNLLAGNMCSGVNAAKWLVRHCYTVSCAVVWCTDYKYDDVDSYDDIEGNGDDNEYGEDSWQYNDLYDDDVEGRPKRGDEQLYENDAEREAVRELLAERAAEEARLALVAYLTSGEPTYRLDEPQYLVDPSAEDLAVEEDEYNELVNGDDEAQPDEYYEEPEVTEKRFYPYSYEPYGGRWGALVPGAKRGDRDPYDRLYRLAEVLSRPAQLGAEVDDYKKK